jgi:pimeloyl-ACP methyl ester carboxylesterase
MFDALPSSAERERYATNGIQLHAITAGPTDGDPVVLLHGFPEFWYGWRNQIPELVDAGYRVIVPDQRGFNRSDKPAGIDAYTIDKPAADALGLLDTLGYDRVNFVGHDWGGAVVWEILLEHPHRVGKAVTMNVPHPSVFREFVLQKPAQLLKSWYMIFFQIPRFPEWLWSADGWRILRWFIDTSNREDTFTGDDLERYREAWSRPGAFTGMLNWYRALTQGSASDRSTPVVEPPNLLIWGMDDPYLHRGMARSSIEYCPNGRLETATDATHWIQHEIPDRVNDLVLSYLEEDD